MSDLQDLDTTERRLTQTFYRIQDSPEQALSGILNLINNNPHISWYDIQVVLTTKGTLRSQLIELVRQNRELRDALERVKGAKGVTWSEFEHACSSKVNTQSRRWTRQLADALRIDLSELTTYRSLDRVPVAMLKRVDDLPDWQPRQPRPRREPDASLDPDAVARFKQAQKNLIRQLKAGGVLPQAAADMVNDLLLSSEKGWDGRLATLATALRVSVSPSTDVPGPNDARPLTRDEIRAMALLWGDSRSNRRATENFFLTHIRFDLAAVNYVKGEDALVQRKLHDIGGDKVRAIREAYHREKALRERNPRFAILSRAFALLPRHTRHRGRPSQDQQMAVADFTAHCTSWFGEPLDLEAAAHFFGHDARQLTQLLTSGRRLPRDLEQCVGAVQTIIGTLNVEDKNFVKVASERVRKFRRETK